MARKEQIEEASKELYKEAFGKAAASCFIKGAEWADNNPDQERISKFTSNLMDENLKLARMVWLFRSAFAEMKDNLCDSRSLRECSQMWYQDVIEICEKKILELK